MKVGKAIYNILSKSTDVQSNFPFNTTDYAPTGTELVTNGDFTAAGINLVSNPNFTDGVEKIVDGDFPLPNVNWTLNSGWTIPVGGSADWATLGSNNPITQSLTFATDKSYKVTFTIANVVGTPVRILIRNQGDVNQDITASWEDFDDGTFTYYFVSSSNNTSINIYGRDDVGDSFSLSNVSVKELGADWIPLASDPDSVSFGENGLTIVQSSDLETDSRVYQSSVTSADKSYKVTYTIHSAQYTSANELKYYDGNSYVDLPEQGAGTHVFYYTREGTNNDWYFNLSTPTPSVTDFVTISSISVQELGEGWTLGTGWTVEDNKAVCDGSANNALNQVLSLPIGNIKVTFKIEDFTSGQLNLWLNLPTFTQVISVDSNGDYEVYATTTSGANNIYFYSVAFIGSVTNISVQEMILTKIFPELAPPDIDAPYIVYSVVSNSPSETKNANGDIDTANIEVYGFQDTYNKAVDLGVSVRAALDRKTGTYNTIQIQSTNYVNEQMDVNEARKLWAAIQDYSIRIKNI
jgi:hypothetical protein